MLPSFLVFFVEVLLMRTKLILAIACAALLCSSGDPVIAAALAPDDPSIAGNLSVWLRDAQNSFDGTTWSDVSGNGNDAVAPGAMPVGISYAAPALSNSEETTGAFAGQNVSGVRFSGAADDLLRATGLNGGTDMGDATIITVYSAPSAASNIQRPAGLGSILTNAGELGDRPVVFNQADDSTLRFDWGQSGAGGLATPADQLFVRGSTLASTVNPGEGIVNDYFDGLLNRNTTTTPGGGGFPVEDALYVGDVRAGVTTVFGSSATNDMFVAEVIVYDTALSQQQIADIGEWLQGNVAQIPEPTTVALLGIGLIGLIGVKLSRKS